MGTVINMPAVTLDPSEAKKRAARREQEERQRRNRMWITRCVILAVLLGVGVMVGVSLAQGWGL